ncbi:MAG: hypothetical protein H5U29_12550, partial [Pusillimonas sp.]|nr:hypothetical protein [Pusillimonas sp.]
MVQQPVKQGGGQPVYGAMACRLIAFSNMIVDVARLARSRRVPMVELAQWLDAGWWPAIVLCVLDDRGGGADTLTGLESGA